jgi:hypothetical protein
MQNPLRKHNRAFVKVVEGVEGSEIYNFAIHHFVHFYSNFWSFSISTVPVEVTSSPRSDVAPARAPGAPAPRRTRRTVGPRPHTRLSEAAARPEVPRPEVAHGPSTLGVRARRMSLLARACAPVPACADRRLPRASGPSLPSLSSVSQRGRTTAIKGAPQGAPRVPVVPQPEPLRWCH